MDSMIALVTIPSAASGVRRVRISVPRVDCLLDGQRYFLPGELPAPEGVDLRPMARPKIGRAARPVRRWTAHDNRAARHRRQQRDEAELAELLGDPV
jgi:hypothetical protein